MQVTIDVADSTLRFAQRISCFGFGVAGFFHLLLHGSNTLAQIFQFFLLACVRAVYA
jgi:hypothetical protein